MPPEAWRAAAETELFQRFIWPWTTPYLVGALAPEGQISVVFADAGIPQLWLMGGVPPDLSRIGKSWALDGRGCAAIDDARVRRGP